MKIISLGWGVQSFTLAVMVAMGDLEPVDYAIHADTTHESKLTYEFAERWTPWLEERGVRVVTVNDAKSADRANNGEMMPVYTAVVERGGTGIQGYLSRNGERGQLMRQCTQRWKITPMRRWIAAELARRDLTKKPGTVEQWIGISTDEYQRMKPSDVKYITNRCPLIERKMSRNDCRLYLEARGLEIPPRSACVFCPYHSMKEWQHVKQTPEDWDEAVRVDRAIRKARPPYDLFVHPARIPLEDVDMRTAEERGQLSLWDNECSGLCGV